MYNLNKFADCKVYKFAALPSHTGRGELQFIRGTLINWRYGSVGTHGVPQREMPSPMAGQSTPMQQCRLGADWAQIYRKGWETIWAWAMRSEESQRIWGCISKSASSKSQNVFPPSIWHLRDCICSTVSSFGLPSIRHWKGLDRSPSRLGGTFCVRVG